MTKINVVQKARKEQGHCSVVGCGKHIGVGDSYSWAQANRYSPRIVHCVDHPTFRRSELDASKLSTALVAIEEAEDALDALDVDNYLDDPASVVGEVESIMQECATGIGECRDEYQESFDNMPENFQEGDTGQQIQEKIDELDNFATDAESWDWNGVGFDDSPDENADEYDIEQAKREWIEEVIDDARETLNAFPL